MLVVQLLERARSRHRLFTQHKNELIERPREPGPKPHSRRLEKAYDAINKLGEVQRVFISRRYLEVKLAELHLVHEHRERVHEEKEELARNKARLREEQKAREEIEQEMAEADQAEAAKQAQLAKLRAEVEVSMATEDNSAQLGMLNARGSGSCLLLMRPCHAFHA